MGLRQTVGRRAASPAADKGVSPLNRKSYYMAALGGGLSLRWMNLPPLQQPTALKVQQSTSHKAFFPIATLPPLDLRLALLLQPVVVNRPVA